MPIPLTKYSKLSQLHIDLSNNSRIYNNYILTCDISDTHIIDGEETRNRQKYLTSKAAHLIHPFSICSNATNKFNNEKKIYKQVDPSNVRCYTLPETTSLDPVSTQKQIQKQVRAPGSLYTMNLGSLHINSNDLHNNDTPWHNASDRRDSHGKTENSASSSHKQNSGVDIKHNSYDRYLGRKKSQFLKTEATATTPKTYTNWPTYWGNKTRTYGLVNCNRTC